MRGARPRTAGNFSKPDRLSSSPQRIFPRVRDPSTHPAEPIRRITRLAPSPTGALHLGNARTFLLTWAIARRHDWTILLRVDDLAGPRIKRAFVDDAIEDIRWLGLDWDGAPILQSTRLDFYRAAMRSLAAQGLLYPCDLSRSEIEAALEAPHDSVRGERRESRFPSSLRPDTRPLTFTREDEHFSWRVVVPDVSVDFEDAITGRQSRRPIDSVGDFIVWTRDGEPAYQLACAVDDLDFHVTDILRGDDLLDSAARQLLLFRALGREVNRPEPRQWHFPLVVGTDGRRLAKRHGDTRLRQYREHGVPPERIISLLARWSGIPAPPDLMSAEEFAAALDPDTIPRTPIVCTNEDDQWLRADFTS